MERSCSATGRRCRAGRPSIQVTRGTTSTDADAVYLSRRGVATGLVSVPLRYMHSPIETVDLEDIERAVQLIVAFALRLEPGLSFAG
jgi:endoglucanase